MKYLNTYKLFERKQMGIIYHFTSLISLYYILKSDEMTTITDINHSVLKAYPSKKNDESSKTFSFTRNKNFAKNLDNGQLNNIITSRIELDGESMSDKYSFKPFNYWANDDVYTKKTVEAEEMIILNDNYLKGILDYIKKITIPRFDFFEEEFEYYVEVEDYQFNSLLNIIENDISWGDDMSDIVYLFIEDREYNKTLIEGVYFYILEKLQEYEIEMEIKKIN